MMVGMMGSKMAGLLEGMKASHLADLSDQYLGNNLEKSWVVNLEYMTVFQLAGLLDCLWVVR